MSIANQLLNDKSQRPVPNKPMRDMEVLRDAAQALEYLTEQLHGHVYWKEIHNGKTHAQAKGLATAAVDDARYTLKNVNTALDAARAGAREAVATSPRDVHKCQTPKPSSD